MAKRAAPKKEAPAKKPPVKRAPRKKKEPAATVHELPVVEEVTADTSKPRPAVKLKVLLGKLANVNPLVKYGILAALFIGFLAWGRSQYNKRQVSKGIKKVEKLHVVEDNKEENVQVLLDSMKLLKEETERLIDEANKATQERVQTEKRGEQIRTENKKQTDETIKRIQNPRNSNSDRINSARALIRSRNLHTGDTIR